MRQVNSSAEIREKDLMQWHSKSMVFPTIHSKIEKGTINTGMSSKHFDNIFRGKVPNNLIRNRGKTMNQIVNDPTLNDKSVKRKVNRSLPARGPHVFTYRHKKHPIQINRRRHEVHRLLELKNQPSSW